MAGLFHRSTEPIGIRLGLIEIEAAYFGRFKIWPMEEIDPVRNAFFLTAYPITARRDLRLPIASAVFDYEFNASNLFGGAYLNAETEQYTLSGGEIAYSLMARLHPVTSEFDLACSDMHPQRSLIIHVEGDDFSFSGNAVTPKRSVVLPTDSIDFSTEGYDILYLNGRVVDMTYGPFFMLTSDVGFSRDLRLDAETMEVDVTGGVAAPQRSLLFDAAGTALVLTGVNSGFLTTDVIKAAAGTFSVTGNAMTVIRTLKAPITAAEFDLTGSNVILTAGIRMLAFAGSFDLTGKDTGLSKASILGAAAASFEIDAQDADFPQGFIIKPTSVSFTLTGVTTGLLDYDRRALEGDESGLRLLEGDESGNRRRI